MARSINRRLKRLVHLANDACAAMMHRRGSCRDTGEFDKLRKNDPKRREWSSLYAFS
ncbi:DUF3410 domain-containing protein [Shigella flexneri]